MIFIQKTKNHKVHIQDPNLDRIASLCGRYTGRGAARWIASGTQRVLTCNDCWDKAMNRRVYYNHVRAMIEG